jgi:hypothetical protein
LRPSPDQGSPAAAGTGRTIVLDLPIPPPVNKTRRVDWASAGQYEAWKRLADRHVMAAGRLPKPISGRFQATVTMADNSRLDLDAIIKALVDYAVRIELVSGDSRRYFRRLVVEWVDPKDAPAGCRLTLTELPDGPSPPRAKRSPAYERIRPAAGPG